MKEKEGRSRKKPREPHSDDLDREAKRGMERKRQRGGDELGMGTKRRAGFLERQCQVLFQDPSK